MISIDMLELCSLAPTDPRCSYCDALPPLSFCSKLISTFYFSPKRPLLLMLLKLTLMAEGFTVIGEF
jgi:hypothetical protein